MAGKTTIEPSEVERAIIASRLPYTKVSAEMWEVTQEDGAKANVGLKDGKLDIPRSKDLKERLSLIICDIRDGMAQMPMVAEETSKIMGLMSQVPGYMPEISIEMIANLVHCPDATPEDLMMLAVTAKNIGANPFLPGEIFLIKPKQRDDGSQPPAYTVIGQTLVAKKLSSAPGFSKAIRGIIVESKEGVVSFKTGNYYNPARETLTGAWAEIQYEDGRTIRKEMPLCELIGNTANWKKMPGLMAAKCVFMMAAREAEPNLMGGCYDIDEMNGSIKQLGIDPAREVSA